MAWTEINNTIVPLGLSSHHHGLWTFGIATTESLWWVPWKET